MSSMKKNLILAAAVSAAVAAPSAFATNGMNMEGYGPVATAMGGASMAYDNGTAAVMNNPATLGLMAEGSRLDLALGRLGPNVHAEGDKSSATAFYMPAVGYIRKQGKISYGVGMFAQGGMGAEYGSDSYSAYGSGETVRSELGVGRLLFPLVYSESNFTVGGTLDYVWAGLDLKMAASGTFFGDMVAGLGGTQRSGAVSGTMVDGLTGYFLGGQITGLNWARFDFSNSNDFTQEAKGTGYAAKIGFTYKVDPQFTLGGSYHSKTSLDDMKASNATVSMSVSGPICGGGTCTVPITGEIKVRDFEWPATAAFGLAYQANDRLLIAGDVKRIGWKSVMKDFKMTFEADTSAANGAFGGAVMDATIFQNWKDQNVFEVGVAYKTSDALTVRGGLNISDNPIPEDYVMALFPAIVKNHVTFGLGYAFDKSSNLDAALTYAPEVKVTNVWNEEIKHSQMNLQVMYSTKF